MKYINREYGFEGRPPYFKEYFEKKSKGPNISNFKYPEKSYAGFGMQSSSPNGVLLSGVLGSVWGASISYQKLGKWVEAEDFLVDIGNFFAANKDGKFAYFNHGDITASIINYSSSKLVMIISGMSKVKVRVDFYPISPSNAKISEDIDIIKGEANERAVIPGKIVIKDFDMEIKDRYDIEFDEADSRKEYFLAKGYFPPNNITKSGNKITYEYALDTQFSRIIFFLSVGGIGIYNEVPDIEEINNGSSKAELVFTAEKMAGSGVLGENLSNAVSRSMWHRIYDPFLGIPVLIEDREKVNEFFSYDSTEMVTGALIQALCGEYESAMKQLQVCAEDKILGAFTAWMLFCRTRNKKVIEEIFPTLTKSIDIDGGLVEADKMTFRQLAYKQTGSPLKDIKNEALYSLDMSCYKLLTIDSMVRMAEVIRHKSLSKLKEAKKELKDNINSTLFNEKLGLYMDRYLSGEFVPIYGANSFLPLCAGVIDDISRLESVALNLKDPKKFSGKFMVPTLAKCHPLYGKMSIDKNGNNIYPYENYRGMIVPRLNFLIYMGLKRYGISETESSIAVSSSYMYAKILKKYNITPNFYLPERKQRSKNSVDNSLSGNLMGFIGMMEMLDVEYFREDNRPALAFGTLTQGNHRLANIEMIGHTFNINISEEETQLVMDGEEIFKGNGGKFVVRHFIESTKGVEFVIYSNEDITLNISLPVFIKPEQAKTLYTFNVEKGKFKVVIDKNSKVQPARLKFNS